MRISKRTAQEIVTELSQIINENINLIDEKSIIIASTDERRVGTYHEGSKKVIAEKLDELIIRKDDEYLGSLPGINLPIEMNGRIIGVIGITGNHTEIEKYGRIIKKVTEILLLDEYRKENKRLTSGAIARFVYEWIFNENYCEDPAFMQQAGLLGIKVERTRNCVILSPVELKVQDSLEQQRVLEKIEKCLVQNAARIPETLIVNTGSKFVCMVPELPDKQLYGFALELRRKVSDECHIILGAGLDGLPVANKTVGQGYKRADKALQVSLKRPEHMPVFYQDLTLELFLPEISYGAKKEFVEKMFRNCTKEERAQFIMLLKVYFDCNGSISQTGERLFLHKNTIQYKLNFMGWGTYHFYLCFFIIINIQDDRPLLIRGLQEKNRGYIYDTAKSAERHVCFLHLSDHRIFAEGVGETAAEAVSSGLYYWWRGGSDFGGTVPGIRDYTGILWRGVGGVDYRGYYLGRIWN